MTRNLEPDAWAARDMTPGALGRFLLQVDPVTVAAGLAQWLAAGDGPLGGPWADSDQARAARRLRLIADELDADGA